MDILALEDLKRYLSNYLETVEHDEQSSLEGFLNYLKDLNTWKED